MQTKMQTKMRVKNEKFNNNAFSQMMKIMKNKEKAYHTNSKKIKLLNMSFSMQIEISNRKKWENYYYQHQKSHKKLRQK